MLIPFGINNLIKSDLNHSSGMAQMISLNQQKTYSYAD
jgi:hypothetical protein